MSDSVLTIEKIEKTQLNGIFNEFLLSSDFEIIYSDYLKHPYIVKISDGVRMFELHYILKNISTGGWEEKKKIKRIQIGNISDGLVPTNKIRTHMLCGLVRCENEYLLVVWNSYLYINHNTNRSCYISNDSLIKCAKKGYIMVHEFNQDIWLCNKEHFGLLIRDYISYHFVE